MALPAIIHGSLEKKSLTEPLSTDTLSHIATIAGISPYGPKWGIFTYGHCLLGFGLDSLLQRTMHYPDVPSGNLT